jgi:hypothetical protein
MRDLRQHISTENTLKLLAKQQRRQILHQIADTPEATSIEHLKTQLVEMDSTDTNRNRTVEQWEAELHHRHLPKLQEMGVIRYDANQGTVRQGPQFEEIFSLLEVIEQHRQDIRSEIS